MKSAISRMLLFALIAFSLVILSFKTRTSFADGGGVSDHVQTSSRASKWAQEIEPSHVPEEVDRTESTERSRKVEDADEEHKRRLESMLEKNDYDLVRLFSYVMLLGSNNDRQDLQGPEDIAQRAQEYRRQLRRELDAMTDTRGRESSSGPRRFLSTTNGLTRTPMEAEARRQ